jgi:uncharacterized protein
MKNFAKSVLNYFAAFNETRFRFSRKLPYEWSNDSFTLDLSIFRKRSSQDRYRMKSDLKKGILAAFRPFDPEKIILFGSHARAEADEGSDIALMVIYRTEKAFLDRLKELYLAWDIPKAVDILAYTPEEFLTMTEESPFVQDAVAEGEVLYEKQ